MSKQERIRRSRPSQPVRQADRVDRDLAGLAWWGGALAVIVAVGVVVFLAVGKSQPAAVGERVSSGPAPAFSEQDVSSGDPVTSAGLRGKDVLLFFSEGVMCQACFEQIQSLQQRSSELRKRGLTLVNVTTDPPDTLREAVDSYGITTPMISDDDRSMSNAYGATGQGMHPNTDGHTFVLIDRKGRIRWRKDYTTMYVKPDQLFAEIPKVH